MNADDTRDEPATPEPPDAEMDELEPAEIEAAAAESETPFEALVREGAQVGPARVRAAVEALLFVADKPLTVEQLHQATGFEREALEAALAALAADRREGASGIALHSIAGGWQLRTDPSAAEYVRRFLKVKPQRLTRAALETLSIIAYRQPVTRPEVEDVRGVDCGAVIKALLERRLVKILGKKDEVGRPLLYGTTREFLECFALKDLASLPTLREFQELSREHQEIVEKELPGSGVPVSVAELADAQFVERLESANAQSEAVLDQLNQAIDAADVSVKTAAETLNRAVAPEPVPEGPALQAPGPVSP